MTIETELDYEALDAAMDAADDAYLAEGDDNLAFKKAVLTAIKTYLASVETELPAVKVKELEWREDWGGSLEDIPEWRAKTPWGSITVSVAGHRDAGGNRYERHSDVSEELYRRLIGSAQADYEQRILSALTLKDDPGNGAVGK